MAIPIVDTADTCKIGNCGSPIRARGWCNKHYQRWYKHGHPGVTIKNTWRLGMESPKTPKATVKPKLRDLYWIAGFLEGEGYFGATSNNSNKVSAAQLQREPLERLQHFLGGVLKKRSLKHCRNNQSHYWRVTGPRARGVMMTLYPLMSPRRKRQIKEALK